MCVRTLLCVFAVPAGLFVYVEPPLTTPTHCSSGKVINIHCMVWKSFGMYGYPSSQGFLKMRIVKSGSMTLVKITWNLVVGSTILLPCYPAFPVSWSAKYLKISQDTVRETNQPKRSHVIYAHTIEQLYRVPCLVLQSSGLDGDFNLQVIKWNQLQALEPALGRQLCVFEYLRRYHSKSSLPSLPTSWLPSLCLQMTQEMPYVTSWIYLWCLVLPEVSRGLEPAHADNAAAAACCALVVSVVRRLFGEVAN